MIMFTFIYICKCACFIVQLFIYYSGICYLEQTNYSLLFIYGLIDWKIIVLIIAVLSL